MLLIAPACRDSDPPQQAPARSAAPAAAAATDPERIGEPPPTLDLLTRLPACQVQHRGILLDLGSKAEIYARGFSIGPHPDSRSLTTGSGETTRILGKRISYDFWVNSEVKDVRLSFRIKGERATRVRVALDDRALGTLRLSDTEFDTLSLTSKTTPLEPGRHTIALRFSGRAAGSHEGVAEVDWIRIASADMPVESYAAPTLKSTLIDVALNDDLKRAMALRPPSSVRCGLRVVPDSELVFSAGFWGNGSGLAAVRIQDESGAVKDVYEEVVSGRDSAQWKDARIRLHDFEGQVIEVQFIARPAPKRKAVDAVRIDNRDDADPGQGRVVFGQPAIASSKPGPEPSPSASTVVIVIFNGLGRSTIPPWGGGNLLARLRDLAKEALAFDHYRLSTTVASGSLASLLSGLHPRQHALEDPMSRLSADIRPVQQIVKEASGRTALFTSVPTSFEPFGMDKYWDAFEVFSPVKDVAATEPFVRAAAWLRERPSDQGRRLVVIHARGGHPPWDLSRQEVESLPPSDYTGRLQARRGGIILSDVRNRRKASLRRLSEQDWIRLEAMQETAMQHQDLAFGKVIQTLRDTGDWNDTLLVVTTEQVVGDPSGVPFAPLAELREDRLIAPLLVKFPGPRQLERTGVSERVDPWVSDLDVAPTVLESFQLDVPSNLLGRSLWTASRGSLSLDGRPLVATLGNRYQSRWGHWLLSGAIGNSPRLCRLDIDPACSTDIAHDRPRVVRELWYRTLEFQTEAFRSRPEVPKVAEIDPDTAKALQVWGH